MTPAFSLPQSGRIGVNRPYLGRDGARPSILTRTTVIRAHSWLKNDAVLVLRLRFASLRMTNFRVHSRYAECCTAGLPASALPASGSRGRPFLVVGPLSHPAPPQFELR